MIRAPNVYPNQLNNMTRLKLLLNLLLIYLYLFHYLHIIVLEMLNQAVWLQNHH